MQLVMDGESRRLASFVNWPLEAEANSLTLARLGFYYSGVGDQVICSGCSLPLDHWKWSEIPAEKHRLLSPMCNFANDGTANEMQLKHISIPNRGSTTTDGSVERNSNSQVSGRDGFKFSEIYESVLHRVGRKGLLMDSSNETSDWQKSEDNGNLRSEAVRLSTFRDWPRDANGDPRALPRGSISDSSDVTIDSVLNENRTIDHRCSPQLKAESIQEKYEEDLDRNFDARDPPKYPTFSKLSARIESFSRGNIPQGQTAKHLAEAGWFHVGPGDKVRCFQCGGNLRDWEPNDDPWAEHSRWYKDCAHLKTQRPTSEPRDQAPTVSDAVRFRIEPREVKARMDTPTVRAILTMGYRKDLVQQVIENRLITIGDDFPNAESLLEAIFALDDPTSSCPPGSSSTSTTYSNDHSTTHVSLIETEGISRLSPVSSSSTTTSSSTSSFTSSATVAVSQLSALHSLTQQKLSHSINSTTQFLSLAKISSQIRSESTANQSESTSDYQSKPKVGKRKRSKKKTSSAAAAAEAMSETQERETGSTPHGEGENANNTNDLKREGIDYQDTLEYAEENQRLRDARTCKVCMDADVNTVFLPCGHLVCCDKCAPHLRDCPICRTLIRGTVKTFLS